MGAKRRENPIPGPTRGVLWAPRRAKVGFARHWGRGYQRTRNLGSSRHPRGVVGANPADRHVPLPRAEPCGCRTRHCPPARHGPGWSSCRSTDGSFCASPPSRVALPAARREPGRPPAAPARRPALDPAGRPARAARLLRPRIVFLCPPIMRDRPEKVKPRFVPDNEPCRRPPSSRSAAPFLLSPRSRAGGRVAHNPRRRNTCLQGSQVLTGTGFAVSRPADCRSARELLE